jgi:hypothetical protein
MNANKYCYNISLLKAAVNHGQFFSLIRRHTGVHVEFAHVQSDKWTEKPSCLKAFTRSFTDWCKFTCGVAAAEIFPIIGLTNNNSNINSVNISTKKTMLKNLTNSAQAKSY